MKRFLLLLALAIALRITFVHYTNYTSEDAHITFQFSRNLVRGNGFSLIPGVPIYGSTTPLLTILLAGWLNLSNDIYLGVRIIALLAFSCSVAFLYFSFMNQRAMLYALLFITLSGKLIAEEMGGMEMPLILLFMAGSLYGFLKGRAVLAGVMGGLMLWTRVDSVFWVLCVFIVILITNPRLAIPFSIAVGTVYLPWVLFSWWYFGSPIPFTIIAKQVAYGIGNPPLGVHLLRVVRYLTYPVVLGVILSIFTIRKKEYMVFPLFFFLEISQLIFTGATFFTRYFYLLTIISFILIGFGVAYTVEHIAKYKNYVHGVLIVVYLIFFMSQINIFHEYHLFQIHLNTDLRHAGEWINKNSNPGSTVLLEPLGIIGWYADRTMYDEVGLATPMAVQLHRNGIDGVDFYLYFNPDYIVGRCTKPEVQEKLSRYYVLTRKFVCYEVWKKRGEQ